ncbi:hypothetical protein OC835_007686, partial [Tilletia horrida]
MVLADDANASVERVRGTLEAFAEALDADQELGDDTEAESLSRQLQPLDDDPQPASEER